MGTGSASSEKPGRSAAFMAASAGGAGGSGAGLDAGDAANSGIIRACDQCRIRKIRCDKESPCSNCRIANRVCSSTGAGQKPREQRQRVLISTQYERKIDSIEERLTSIEKLLRQLTQTSHANHLHLQTTLPLHEHPPSAASQHSPERQFRHHHHHHRSLSNTTTGGDRDHDDLGGGGGGGGSLSGSSTPGGRSSSLDTSAFEGNSSLTAHTQFASEFLEHAVERTSLRDLNPNMAAALSSLKQIVGLSQQQRARNNNPATSTNTTGGGGGAHRRGSNGSSGGGGGGGLGAASVREVRFAHQRVLPRGGFRDLGMPPVTAVIPVLREIKETPPGTFTLISVCCFMAVENFAEACRRVYFALDDFSQATFIIVNAGLYYLFQEKSVTAESDAAVAEYTAYYELCRDNLETGLANLKFFLGASMETIEALLLGASYAIEVSRPSLAWQLNTTAAQLCQDLGYHRVTGGTVGADRSEPGSGSSEAGAAASGVGNGSTAAGGGLGGGGGGGGSALNDKKAILFWFSYMLDRGLALRLGRAPIIQDFDVTLPRVIGQVNATDMWKEVLRLWIAHSDIQGQIYEKLYSPTSLSHPVGQRVEAAQGLAAKLKMIAEQAGLLRTGEMRRHSSRGGEGGWADARKATVTEMVMKSDQVSFLSSLTLVYRAIPPGFAGGSTFTSECIETARLAMQTHEECMKLMGSNLWVAASYIHWTILYAPFVPFIVIFCHIIETSNVADLHRLRDFIDSLQPTCSVSEGIEKLHRLFSVLYNVAMLYVEAKSKASQHQDTDMTPIGNEFDVYLSALGFMPVDEAAGLHAGVAGTGGPGAPAAMTASPTSATSAGPGPGAGGDAARFAAAQSAHANAMAVQHQTSQLGDWFSGNRYMMGLLEEDLSQFHPNAWNSGGV